MCPQCSAREGCEATEPKVQGHAKTSVKAWPDYARTRLTGAPGGEAHRVERSDDDVVKHTRFYKRRRVAQPSGDGAR